MNDKRAGNKKPQIVLDIAGVLVNNFSSTYWGRLVLPDSVTGLELLAFFHEMKRDLWTGVCSEGCFWIELAQRFPDLDTQFMQTALRESLHVLPAIHHLERWCEQADLHLLSNHCKEWLEPNLHQIKPFTKSITISNQLGLCKPDIQIYRAVEARMENVEYILYVDDQQKNLIPAEALGWQTVLADEQGEWVHRIDNWVEEAKSG